MSLRPWRIDAWLLSSSRTIELLRLCKGRETLGSGVIVGKDLAFWVTALNFAAVFMAKEQFLLGLIEQDGVYRARWQRSFHRPTKSACPASPKICQHPGGH